jgi:uncharacterized protein YceK
MRYTDYLRKIAVLVAVSLGLMGCNSSTCLHSHLENYTYYTYSCIDYVYEDHIEECTAYLPHMHVVLTTVCDQWSDK